MGARHTTGTPASSSGDRMAVKTERAEMGWRKTRWRQGDGTVEHNQMARDSEAGYPFDIGVNPQAKMNEMPT